MLLGTIKGIFVTVDVLADVGSYRSSAVSAPKA
jgi:hypothetical protein